MASRPFLWLLTLCSALALLTQCGTNPHGAEVTARGDTLTRYASALTLVRYPDYIAADVRVPWQKTLLARYVIPSRPDVTLPEGRTVIIPDSSGIISFSSVYSSALAEFGALGRLRAVADPAYLSPSDTVAKLVASGRIADAGSSLAPMIEKIIDAEPSLVFASPYETGGAVAAMQRAGLPLVLMADYVESDPRGRAEWMRFIGYATGTAPRADSLVDSAIDRYNALKATAAQAPRQPKVITEKPLQGVWYVPGGRSYLARLIADAGGRYAWADDSTTASMPMSLENVLERGADADIWLLKEAEPIDARSLAAMVPQAAAFKAMPHGVWVCNTLDSPYFNHIALHPDRILEAYISILHPELAGDSLRLRYYSPLK